jgi:2-amino-4-hydroxy-6-hydroxymethyldihydropteridine diphosphokinase
MRMGPSGADSSAVPVVLALGSNLGCRIYELRRGVHQLRSAVRVVRLSPVIETIPVDAPRDSPLFLNMVVAGWTRLRPRALLEAIHEIERSRGRTRRLRNEPRRLDIDIIFYGSRLLVSPDLTLPHPRWREREFVLQPLRRLALRWTDPASSRPLYRY